MTVGLAGPKPVLTAEDKAFVRCGGRGLTANLEDMGNQTRFPGPRRNHASRDSTATERSARPRNAGAGAAGQARPDGDPEPPPCARSGGRVRPARHPRLRGRVVPQRFGRTAALAGARVLTGGCLALGTDGLPYAPFTAVLRDLVHEMGADAVASMLPGRTTRGLARLLPELGEPDTGGDPAEARARL